jgi:hypothetical protein
MSAIPVSYVPTRVTKMQPHLLISRTHMLRSLLHSCNSSIEADQMLAITTGSGFTSALPSIHGFKGLPQGQLGCSYGLTGA